MKYLRFILIVILTSNIFAQVTLESSNLPIVIINTGGQEIPNNYKITADMGIIYKGSGQRNYMTDSLNNYDGKIGIELRGSSSQHFPKKQYAVETRNEIGENRNVSLLGLPEENDWILYAPFSDKSLMRNVLFEKIKRDNNRVNISRLNTSDVSGDALSGGYIIKIDKKDGEEINGWYSAYRPISSSLFKIYYQYHYPRPDDILEEQKSYIEAYIDEFEDLMYSWNYDDPVSGYSGMIDVPSFVDFFLLNEISKNVDGYRLSTFYYKNRDSDDPYLYIGPVWDFNLAFGNADYYDGGETDAWQVEINRLGSFKYDGFKIPFYWERFLNDSAFVSGIVDRWQELRSDHFHIDSIYSFIDEQILYLDEAQQRNFEQWPILDIYVWPNYYIGGSYSNEITYLKNWIQERINWMDEILFDTIPPDAIKNLRITGTTNSSITVAWEASSDNNRISGYDIFLDGEKVRYSISLNCTIDEITESKEYQIEVKARDYAGNYSEGNPVIPVIFTAISKEGQTIKYFQLHQNYPNPFNPITTIEFDIHKFEYIDMTIYNIIGEKVKSVVSKYMEPGSYKYIWNASDLPSGIYYCEFASKSYQKSIKLILIK